MGLGGVATILLDTVIPLCYRHPLNTLTLNKTIFADLPRTIHGLAIALIRALSKLMPLKYNCLLNSSTPPPASLFNSMQKMFGILIQLRLNICLLNVLSDLQVALGPVRPEHEWFRIAKSL